MRRHLVDPPRHAGVGRARKDRIGPFVVARPLQRVPRAGVAGAVIDEVEVGIISDPAPGRAAARLPLFAFPALQRGIDPDRPPELHRLPGIDHHRRVRSGRRRRPQPFAIRQRVGREAPERAVLAAADADDHLVLHDQRRARHRLAAERIAVLRLPLDGARLGIERDQRRVGLRQQHLAVRVGEPAAHRVAAHHGGDGRILPRLVFPQDAALAIKVQRIDDVGEGRVDIHHVADDQRGSLVSTQHAGRKAPHGLQAVHVVGRDLPQRAEPLARVAAAGHHPGAGVPLHAGEAIVGPSMAERGNREHRQGDAFARWS